MTSCGVAWFQSSGMVSKGRRNALVSPGARPPIFRLMIGTRSPQDYLAVGVVKDAIDLHQREFTVAGVSDVAGDLHHLLLQIACVRLHLDAAEQQIMHVGARFGGQRRRRRRRLMRGAVEIHEIPRRPESPPAPITMASGGILPFFFSR